MGVFEEDELKEAIASVPKLKLPFVERAESPEHPSTPPFQATATAAVPFKWEEQPGKPRPCSDIIARPEPARSLPLELPPKFTKTPSPTTVLDGPYNVGRPKFSSFRFFRDGGVHDSSFAATPEARALLGGSRRRGGFFGKFKGGGKREVDGCGSCRFSPSTSVSSYESEETFAMTAGMKLKSNCAVKMRRNGSFSTISSHANNNNKSSQLWTSIYQGIKHVMHWKGSKKSNKEGRD